MKNRKKNTKLVLLLLLVCITLGYAALRTGLNINGTANVSSSSWNVYFSNYQMSNATNITPTTEPSISGTTTTSISYEVDLDVPGDLYEFSVEVVNGGSLDANISLVSKYNGTEIDAQHPVPAYITYTVTDENGDPIVDNHRLNHGEREIVKVYVKYRDDDASVLPAQDAPGLSFDIEIEATKAEKEPEPTENAVYAMLVPIDRTLNVSTETALSDIGDPFQIIDYNTYCYIENRYLDDGQIIPHEETQLSCYYDHEIGSTEFETLSDCQDYLSSNGYEGYSCIKRPSMPNGVWTTNWRTLGSKTMLKLILDDSDVVERVDVCYVYDNNLHCLEGNTSWDDPNIAQKYAKNHLILEQTFGSSNCDDSSDDSFHCSDSIFSSVSVYLDSNDFANVFTEYDIGYYGIYEYYCSIYLGGGGLCAERD